MESASSESTKSPGDDIDNCNHSRSQDVEEQNFYKEEMRKDRQIRNQVKNNTLSGANS